MNEVLIFNNPAFGNVRVTKQDGKVWFVASDVCGILGIGLTGHT